MQIEATEGPSVKVVMGFARYPNSSLVRMSHSSPEPSPTSLHSHESLISLKATPTVLPDSSPSFDKTNQVRIRHYSPPLCAAASSRPVRGQTFIRPLSQIHQVDTYQNPLYPPPFISHTTPLPFLAFPSPSTSHSIPSPAPKNAPSPQPPLHIPTPRPGNKAQRLTPTSPQSRHSRALDLSRQRTVHAVGAAGKAEGIGDPVCLCKVCERV